MAYINVTCGNCGIFLGKITVPVLGVDPNFNGCKGTRTDPDCDKCNSYYWNTCKNCNEQAIDTNGICRSCKTSNS